MPKRPSNAGIILRALLTSSLVSIGLYLYGAIRNSSYDFSYLPGNLLLAWIPLLAAAALRVLLKREIWSAWRPLAASVIWLLFLPNTFYMISDFIHLHEVQRVDLLFDAVMFTSFIYTSVAIGFASLWLVHEELEKRLKSKAYYGIGTVLLLCSFGIYIGRDLRWNSWDILTNPGGLLFDISDRLLHAASYPQMFVTVLSFFALLASMYYLVWQIGGALRQSK